MFIVIIVGAFKMKTRMGKKRDLTTWTIQHKRVNVTLIFLTSTRDATEIGPRDKKDLHKTWLTECFLIRQNSDLHDVLRSNWARGLSSGTKFLDIGS